MPPATKKPRAVPSSIDALREAMTKKYGDGRVRRREEVKPYEVCSTGSLSLDLALRVGGWVEGRIHEIVGVEGASKTTLAINAMREHQKKYPKKAAGYVDMEQTFDYDWAESNGLDTSSGRFVHAYPDNSEDVSDQIKEMIETGLFSIVVVDSIGGMESKQAFDKEADEVVMGRNAQVITRMSKRLAMLARRHGVTILLINQYRANLSGMGNDISAGPKAMKYATTTKVEVRRTFDDGDTLLYQFPGEKEKDIVGKGVAAKVSRNKVAAEGKTGRFTLVIQETPDYGPVGIDQGSEAYAIGVFTGVILVEGGGYHTMPWTKDKKDRIRGKETVVAYLRANPDKALEVRDAAVAKMAADVQPETVLKFDPVTGEVLDEVSA